MSWGEVKKINSDLTTPLNVLLWVNELKTYGSSSYVCFNQTILEELAKYNFICSDHVCRKLIFDAVSSNGHIGKFIKNVCNIDDPTLDNADTIFKAFTNDNAITATFTNKNLANLWFFSSTVLSAAKKDTNILTALRENQAFINDITTNSEHANQFLRDIGQASLKTLLGSDTFANAVLNNDLCMEAVISRNNEAFSYAMSSSAKLLNIFFKGNLSAENKIKFCSTFHDACISAIKLRFAETQYFRLVRSNTEKLLTGQTIFSINATHYVGNASNVLEYDNSIVFMNKLMSANSSSYEYMWGKEIGQANMENKDDALFNVTAPMGSGYKDINKFCYGGMKVRSTKYDFRATFDVYVPV